MKKTLPYLMAIAFLLTFTSCATIFTSSSQPITFTGEEGIKIYDVTTNSKLTEIGSGNSATIKISKGLDDKYILAKKEGYKNGHFNIQSSFNSISILNIFIWPGFLVDFLTGKINKYDNSVVNIELEKE